MCDHQFRHTFLLRIFHNITTIIAVVVAAVINTITITIIVFGKQFGRGRGSGAVQIVHDVTAIHHGDHGIENEPVHEWHLIEHGVVPEGADVGGIGDATQFNDNVIELFLWFS